MAPSAPATLVLAVGLAAASNACAQTCEDQHKACLSRGHTEAECRVSTNRCLETGRWIGPAGREFPISKRK